MRLAWSGLQKAMPHNEVSFGDEVSIGNNLQGPGKVRATESSRIHEPHAIAKRPFLKERLPCTSQGAYTLEVGMNAAPLRTSGLHSREIRRRTVKGGKKGVLKSRSPGRTVGGLQWRAAPGGRGRICSNRWTASAETRPCSSSPANGFISGRSSRQRAHSHGHCAHGVGLRGREC